MTLRQRIAAVAGLAVAITVLLAAVAIFVAVRAQLHHPIDDALRARAQELAAGQDPDNDNDSVCGPAAADRDRSFPAPRADRDDARFGGAEGYAQIVCADGTVVRPVGATTKLPATGSARAIARSGSGETLVSTHVAGTHLRVLTRALASRLGAVQVARPLNEVDDTLRDILAVLAIFAASGVALAAGLGALVARSALAPVRRFTRRTEEIAGNADTAERIVATGDDELARLARSFNATLDALERSVEAQRHLVADASHELRTPIASLRANIETLEDADRLPEDDRAALRADILQELDELTALVGDVVELARGSKPGRVLDDVRVDRIAADLVERAKRRAGSAIAFHVDLEPTVVRGEPGRVDRAISNLLDNAMKFSPPDGAIEVTLRDGTLTVRDHGPGIAPANIPHVFERFHRADEARGMPGSGLGLAIVRQAAEAHGGSVEAANAPGGGATISVRFEP
ncbi:MAG: two-component system, OmpR family, sensor histidine kinase MprB [Solirubrobacteraceae bacterium]|jgi:two-component system sensor histidine kinase MprB|nr:two-component system, OmpR family, sensor histidine kinase MprB [Solirubrobacteraceae bacterium]